MTIAAGYPTPSPAISHSSADFRERDMTDSTLRADGRKLAVEVTGG